MDTIALLATGRSSAVLAYPQSQRRKPPLWVNAVWIEQGTSRAGLALGAVRAGAESGSGHGSRHALAHERCTGMRLASGDALGGHARHALVPARCQQRGQ